MAEEQTLAESTEEEQSPPATTPERPEPVELDVSRIARPELIVRPDVSAILIPKISEAAGTMHGQWFLYLHDRNGRRCEPLEYDSIFLSDGSRLYLSPMPPEPSKLDVAEYGRWSAESRYKWLRGEQSPTTAEVLAMVSQRIDRYICLPEKMRKGHGFTLATWAMMTYVFRALPAVPYLYLAGPLGSGKSRVMEVLHRMVWRPMMASSLTGPTLFRGKHASGGTLLLDEAERMRDDSPEVVELRSMLLAGYKQGGQARRLEPVGDSFRMVAFDVFGPVVLGCIKGLPAALSSRCITVKMMRAPKGDERAKRSLDDSPKQWRQVLDSLHCWALDYGHNAITTEPVDIGLSNRDLELWRPLLSIATHAADQQLIDCLAEHAREMTDASSDDRAPDADPVFVLALHQMLSEGLSPEPAEVLARARELEPGWFDSWSARGLSGVLANYSIETTKTAGRRKYRIDPATVGRIAERYGFDLGGNDDAS